MARPSRPRAAPTNYGAARAEVGDPPPPDDPGQTLVVVVDHDHRDTAQVQLLDRSQADAVEATDDHVPVGPLDAGRLGAPTAGRLPSSGVTGAGANPARRAT